MPQIPIYEQRTSASQAGLGPGPESAGQNVLGMLAAGTSIVADAVLQRREERAAVAAGEEEMASRTFWMHQLKDRKQVAPPGAEGFTDAMLKDFDADAAERVKRIKTKQGQAWLKQRLAQARLGVHQEAMGLEAAKLGELKINGLNGSLGSARTAADFRPDDYEEILAGQLSAIDASGLEGRERMAMQAVHALADAAVGGLIRRDPYGALKELNNEQSEVAAVRDLEFSDRQRLRNAAESEIRSRDAEKRAALSDDKAAMSDHFRDMQVAASLGLAVQAPSRAQLVALFGEAEGASKFKTAQNLAVLSNDVAKLQDMPTAGLMAKVASYAPTRVQGAAEQVQLQAALASSASQIIEQRAKDPAGYLSQHSKLVQRAWQEMAQDPAKAPQYLAAVRAEKERLGIPGKDVLPDAYVASLADDVSGVPAEQIADRLDEERQRWGKAWAQVYGQLAPKLPDMAAVIGSGIPKPAATALAATAGLKEPELKAMLPSSVKLSDIDESVSSVFEEFVRSMPPETGRTTAAIRDAAARLTIKYMNDGESRNNAVKRAYRDLVGSQYELVPLRGHYMRLPVDGNVTAIELGARRALQQFSADSNMVEMPAGAAMDPMYYAERYTSDVRSRGYWVTNPDSTGLRMYVDGAPVVRAGEPVDMSWEDLTGTPALSPDLTVADFDLPPQ